jgi:hypothetical protein
MTVRRLLLGLVTAGALAVTAAGCSDSSADDPDGASTVQGTSSTPTTPAPPPQTLPALPKPSKAWPTPSVTGAPADDAPLADRIRFSIAKRVQVAAGKAGKTTVSCPGLDEVESGSGSRTITCTVTYGGQSFSGRLVVDAKRYSASYSFTSESVAVARAKVVDAVTRVAVNPAKVSCTMGDVAVVKHADPDGIACTVTDTAGAETQYTARVSGDGKVTAAKM